MKRYIFLTIGLLFFISIFSQRIKTYQGPFEVENGLDNCSPYSGNAIYQYYEDSDSHERIFQGSFTLKGTDFQISGNYKNNRKNGAWKIIIFNGQKENCNSKRCPTLGGCVETAKGTYLNGKLNGVWTYTIVDNATNKTFVKSMAQFKNNIMIGLYTYNALTSEYRDNEGFEIKINLDSIGLIDGDYLVKYTCGGIPFEDHRKFQSGKEQSKLLRNLTTGQILLDSHKNADCEANIDHAIDFWLLRENWKTFWTSGLGWDNPIFVLLWGTNLDNLLK